MEKINKGGRIPKAKQHLFNRRKEIVKMLLKEGYIKSDIAIILSIHPSQISRI